MATSLRDALEKALRDRSEAAGFSLRDDGNTTVIRNGIPGIRLTVTYHPEYISLSYNGAIGHSHSYIICVPSPGGVKLHVKNHPALMEADDVAAYLVGRMLKDEMP